MKLTQAIGRCVPAFYIAVIFDLVGILLLLLGIFASFSTWDFFIYTGAIIIALSLVFWVLWYTFNVEISYKELELLV